MNKAMKRALLKTSLVSLRVLPKTIRKEQEAMLRELVEKTGKKISEVVREAVEESFEI